jgi:hypothetical protein
MIVNQKMNEMLSQQVHMVGLFCGTAVFHLHQNTLLPIGPYTSVIFVALHLKTLCQFMFTKSTTCIYGVLILYL